METLKKKFAGPNGALDFGHGRGRVCSYHRLTTILHRFPCRSPQFTYCSFSISLLHICTLTPLPRLVNNCSTKPLIIVCVVNSQINFPSGKSPPNPLRCAKDVRFGLVTAPPHTPNRISLDPGLFFIVVAAEQRQKIYVNWPFSHHSGASLIWWRYFWCR